MKKKAFWLMIITIFAKILGFLRDIFLSYHYGASNISDVYLIALTIPTVLFSLVGTGINTSYIPIVSRLSKEEERYFTNNLITISFLACILICVVVCSFPNQILGIFAAGFDSETKALGIDFLRISIWSIIFTNIISVLVSYLNVNDSFVIPGARSIPMNAMTIIFVFLASYNQKPIILAIGILFSLIAEFLFLIPFAKNKGLKYKPVVNLNDSNIKTLIKLTVPIVWGVSVNQINVIIDRSLASAILSGGVSALTYSNRIYQFIEGIFITSIVSIIYPILSKLVKDNLDKFKFTLIETLTMVNMLIVPISIFLIFFSQVIVNIVFGRGAFNLDNQKITAAALLCYSIGMMGFSSREILTKAFYALHDTRTPVINATIGIFINILFNLIFSKYIGVSGIALATSLSALITMLLLFKSLQKKIDISFNAYYRDVFIITIVSIVLNYLGLVFYNSIIITNIFLKIILTIFLLIFTYYFLLAIFKIGSIDKLNKFILSKLKRG